MEVMVEDMVATVVEEEEDMAAIVVVEGEDMVEIVAAVVEEDMEATVEEVEETEDTAAAEVEEEEMEVTEMAKEVVDMEATEAVEEEDMVEGAGGILLAMGATVTIRSPKKIPFSCLVCLTKPMRTILRIILAQLVLLRLTKDYRSLRFGCTATKPPVDLRENVP